MIVSSYCEPPGWISPDGFALWFVQTSGMLSIDLKGHSPIRPLPLFLALTLIHLRVTLNSLRSQNCSKT